MTTNETNDTKQSWKRPWTLNEIVKSSTDWSLAADAGVCELLKKLSTDLINDINQVNNNVSEYALESKDTNVRIQNTFNDLCMLANDQFMESLVEDVGSTISDKSFGLTEMTNASNSQQIKEDKLKEAENQISLSLKFGMEVLDSQFELLDVTKLVSASRASGDDEYENVDPISRPVSLSNIDFTTNDPIYHPKDPYENRHLPHIIGTSSFIEDDSLGIGYLDDQEMEDEEEDLSDDNILHDHDATSMANLDSLSTISGDETKSIEIKIPNVDNQNQSEFMSDDDIFAEAKTEDDIDDILNTRDEEYESGMVTREEPVKRELTMADRLHDQLKKKFNEQNNDSLSQNSQDSSSLNQKRKSDYSSSKVPNNEKSVFSTEDVDDDYDPFNDIIIPNKKSNPSKATSSNTGTTTSLTSSSIASTKQQTIDSHKNSTKETPKNVKTSLLNQNKFISDEDEDDDDFLFQDKPLPKMDRVIKSMKQEKSTLYQSSNLFSDDDDDDGLFSTNAKPRISVPVNNSSKFNDKTKTKVNLKFPDKVVTEPKDMFTNESVKEPDTKQSKSEIVGSKETNSKRLTKKFIPSDDSDDDFFKEISSNKSSQANKKTTQSSSTIVDGTTSKTLDKEEDTVNSLFNEYATVKPKNKKQDYENKPNINKQDSNSDLEDESSYSQKIKSENSATYSIDQEGKSDVIPGLISSFDEDISGGKTGVTHSVTQPQKNNAGSAGNYFNDNSEQKSVEVPQERPSIKKPPVGGFSMFPGGMHQHLDLLGEMKRKSQFKSTQQENEEATVKRNIEDKPMKQNDCVEHTDEQIKSHSNNSLGFPIIRASHLINKHNSGNIGVDGDEVGLDIDTPIHSQPRLTNLTKSRPRGNPKRKPTFKKNNSSITSNRGNVEDSYQNKKPDLSDDLTNNLSAKSKTENSNSTDLFASYEDTKTPENPNIETTNKPSSISDNKLDIKPISSSGIKPATDIFGDTDDDDDDDDDTEDLFSNLQTNSKSKKLISDKSENNNKIITNNDDYEDEEIFKKLPLEAKPDSIKQNIVKDTNKNNDAVTVNDDDDDDIFNNLPLEAKPMSIKQNTDKVTNTINNITVNDNVDDSDGDDIFSNLPSETKSASKNKNADINNKNNNNADNNTNDDDDDDDDDIFSNLPVPLEKKSKLKKKVVKKAVGTKIDVEEIDDIFAIPSSTKKKPLKKKSSKISKDPLGAI